MFTHETNIRVRYSETDQMRYVYYGQYAAYFEVGRVEAMRSLGIRYASLEEDHGILMPVMNMHVRYLRPAEYDELLLHHSCGNLGIQHCIYIPLQYCLAGMKGTPNVLVSLEKRHWYSHFQRP